MVSKSKLLFTILLIHQIIGSHSDSSLQSTSSFFKALLNSAISNYQPKYASGIKKLLYPSNSGIEKDEQPSASQNSPNFLPASNYHQSGLTASNPQDFQSYLPTSAAQNSQNFLPASQYYQSGIPASNPQDFQRNFPNSASQSSQNFLSTLTKQNPQIALQTSTTQRSQSALSASTTQIVQSSLSGLTTQSALQDLTTQSPHSAATPSASDSQNSQNFIPAEVTQNSQSTLPTKTAQNFENNLPSFTTHSAQSSLSARNPQNIVPASIAQNSQHSLQASIKPSPQGTVHAQNFHNFLYNSGAQTYQNDLPGPIAQYSYNFPPVSTAQSFYRAPTTQHSQFRKADNLQTNLPYPTAVPKAQNSLSVPKAHSSQSSFPINLDIEAKLDYSSLKGTLYNIGQAFYDFVDVAMVRSLVDLYMNKRNKPAIARSELIFKGEAKVNPREEKVRDGLTSILGGIMGKQQCWEKMFCGIGEMGKSISGTSVAFLILKSSVPSTWTKTRQTIDLIKQGTRGDCQKKFKCDSKRT